MRGSSGCTKSSTLKRCGTALESRRVRAANPDVVVAARRPPRTDQLLAATQAAFVEHPDAEIITSFPGLGAINGARLLAEIGDDRGRFRNARALKAYAGSAAITRASGKSRLVMHRRVKNDRLAATVSFQPAGQVPTVLDREPNRLPVTVATGCGQGVCPLHRPAVVAARAPPPTDARPGRPRRACGSSCGRLPRS